MPDTPSMQPPDASESVEPAQRRFPCAQCGAELDFAPGTISLKCAHCGAENEIDAPQTDVQEQDYAATLNALADAAPKHETPVVKCEACAAEVTRAANVSSFACPFCGTNIVSPDSCPTRVRPTAVLPFRVTRQQAEDSFRAWLRTLWFAPSELKRQARLEAHVKGVYLPYWTYDCGVTTAYEGARGEYYYVTVPYTTRVNGRTVTRTRRERRTRWYPASGVVHNVFDDVLVAASATLPPKEEQALRPWDLASMAPYADEYFSGFVAETYQLELADGFETAKGMMRPTIEQTVRGDIGGDVQRISVLRPRYEDIRFKLVSLPVWISAYRFSGKLFHFFVNARTGEVTGRRPWSWVKIAALVGVILAVAGVVILIVTRS